MSQTTYRYFFKYYGNYDTKSVEIIGDFNDWKPGKLNLKVIGGDTVWKGFVDLPSGRYEYQFLIDGKETAADNKNPSFLTKDKKKSIIVCGTEALKGDAFHTPDLIDEYSENIFYIKIGARKDIFDSAELILVIKDAPKTIVGYSLYSDENYNYYVFKFENEKPIKDFLYYFELHKIGAEKVYFGSNGIIESEWEVDNFEYAGLKKPPLKAPEWVRTAVFYQIFPERFFNGNTENDPPNVSKPFEKPTSTSFYGGDLEGVTKKIPYLNELGINSIYFNPVFESPSPHKYDTTDYKKIDPHFGGETAYDALASGLQKAGIRFILDGVFNHTSPEFKPFRDIEQKKEKSEYLDWFTVKKFPLVTDGKPNYDCWWGFASMPKLNFKNPDVKKYILDVAGHWLSKGASGWRLDVAEEIPLSFWKEFREVVKSVNPEAYITGEIWWDANDWLKGDAFDSVMNYRFRDACLGFFRREEMNAENFAREIGNLVLTTPMQACFSFLNLLSSHDTARFYTLIEKDMVKLKLALAFQFTFIGAPCIYYGEEIGMEGNRDPDNRQYMIWDEKKKNKEIENFYKDLIRIRKENPILQHGDFRFIYAQDRVIGFERFQKDQKLTIFINNSDKSVQIDVTRIFGNGDFIDISKDHPLKRKKAYTLYENEFVILKKVKDR